MMWPGSEYDYAGINSTYIAVYDKAFEWKDRVNKALSWFMNETKPADLVMAYFEQPDSISHTFGPNSPQVNEQIKKVDDIILYIFDHLKVNNLEDINVIILSDHGMEGVTEDHLIDLRPLVGDIADMYGRSPVLQVHPHEGKLNDVYKKLKQFAEENSNFYVYKRQDIPERFHYKKCTRTPPIMVLARPKYAFHDLIERFKSLKISNGVTDTNTFGVHGYDPVTMNMHPYFFACGPNFKENYRADHLYTVDMYLLFSQILKLNPIYFDGNKTRILEILRT